MAKGNAQAATKHAEPAPLIDEVPPQPAPAPKSTTPEKPVDGDAPAIKLPDGFKPMDEAPKDGRTVKLWFGEGSDQTSDKYIVLGRWRSSRQYVSGQRAWVKTGFWCHPHSLVKIGFEFRGWAPSDRISQAEIETSNAAVAAGIEAQKRRAEQREQRRG